MPSRTRMEQMAVTIPVTTSILTLTFSRSRTVMICDVILIITPGRFSRFRINLSCSKRWPPLQKIAAGLSAKKLTAAPHHMYSRFAWCQGGRKCRRTLEFCGKLPYNVSRSGIAMTGSWTFSQKRSACFSRCSGADAIFISKANPSESRSVGSSSLVTIALSPPCKN